MTENYIKDWKTQLIIGIVRTEPNGDQVAIDFASRQILGKYKADINKTVDFYGRYIADGNCVQSLIYDYHSKK